MIQDTCSTIGNKVIKNTHVFQESLPRVTVELAQLVALEMIFSFACQQRLRLRRCWVRWLLIYGSHDMLLLLLRKVLSAFPIRR